MKQKKALLSVCMRPYMPAIALVAVLFSVKDNAIRGVTYPAGEGELLIRDFFKWHLLTIPPLLFASEYLSVMETMEVFIRMRIQSDKTLCRILCFTCLIASALWGLLLSAIVFLRGTAAPAEILVIMIGHTMWMSLYLVAYFAFHSVADAIVAIVLFIGMTFYVGELTDPWCPLVLTSWAMVARTEIFDAQGIPLTLSVGGCLSVIVLSLVTVHFINQRRRVLL